jgi:GNAT superfamily N-acetyltransferase
METPDTPSAATVTIRHATPADAAKLHGLLTLYFDEWSIWQRDTPETVISVIYQDPTLGYFVAERDDVLLGCVLCYRLTGIRRASEIKRLYVRPEARGQGLGKLIFETAEQAARSAGLTWMYLDSTNEFTAALSLYHKHGYEPCDRFNVNAQATLFFRKRLA